MKTGSLYKSQWHWQEPGTAWRGCGIYHLTLTQTDRTAPLLGRLTSSPAVSTIPSSPSSSAPAPAPSVPSSLSAPSSSSSFPGDSIAAPSAPQVTVERTPLGNAIVEQFLAIPTHRPEVKLLAFCLMPDHFHGVLYVTREMQSGIMSLVRGFWQGCKKEGRAYSASLQAAPQSPSSFPGDSIAPQSPSSFPSDSIAPQSPSSFPSDSIAPQSPSSFPGDSIAGSPSLPDPIFHQMPFVVPLSGKGQLQRMIAYVHDNPRRAWLKRTYPDLFRLRRELLVSQSGAQMVFSAMGNQFLLDWPMQQLVECSRTMSQDRFDAQLQQVMQRAQQGFVTITAAINQWERQIAQAVRSAGHPLIILLKDGFPTPGSEHERFFKPQGIYFEACAAGRLLLLEPTEQTFTDPVVYHRTHVDLQRKAELKHYSYTPLPTTSTRYRFVALNNLGRLLTERVSLP